MEKKRSSLPPTGVINFSIFRHQNIIEAIYIKLGDGKVFKSKEIGAHAEAVVDLDKNGKVIGIEVLEPDHLSAKVLNKIRREFKIQELKHFKIDRLQEAFA